MRPRDLTADRLQNASLVGREREVSALLALLADSHARKVAHAAVVIGAAGIGKSRFAREIAMLAAERGTAVWVGRGDPNGRPAPFGVLGGMLSRLAQIGSKDSLAVRQKKLRERIGRHVAADVLWETATVLGEASGISSFDGMTVDDENPPQRGSTWLADLALGAWETFLSAELAQGSVLLLIDDVHGADVPTVRLLGATLRNLQDKPLSVLALARPELERAYPGLFAEHNPLLLSLAELSEVASRDLLRAFTKDRLAPATVADLVARSGGNPFVLEGLARAEEGGSSAGLPETPLSLCAARMNAAPAETRRLLRAVSVLGDAVFPADVAALLAGVMDGPAVDLAIHDARQRGLMELRAASAGSGPMSTRGPLSATGSLGNAGPLSTTGPVPSVVGGGATGEKKSAEAAVSELGPISLRAPGGGLAFTSPLVREVAYSLFTEEERMRAHRLAGQRLSAEWRDPAILAWHFELGGASDLAIEPYKAAAMRALAANDFEAAIARARRAEVCGAEGVSLGEVSRLLADAHVWRGETVDAEREARRAMGLLAPGTVTWLQASATCAMAAARLGDTDTLHGAARDLESLAATTPLGSTDAPLRVAQVVAMSRISIALLHAGEAEAASGLLGRMHALRIAGALNNLPYALGFAHRAAAIRAHIKDELLGAFLSFDAAATSFEKARVLRDACVDHANAGFLRMELGQNDDAEKRLSSALAAAQRLGLPTVTANAQLNLCLLLGRRGAGISAAAMGETALGTYEKQGAARAQTIALVYLARTLVTSGETAAALSRAKRAAAFSEDVPPYRAYALAALSTAERAAGHLEAARDAAERAMDALCDVGTEEGEAFIRLSYAQALQAAGNSEDARTALFEADSILQARAAKITDPMLRASFLQNVPEHARTIELSDALGVGQFARANTRLAPSK